MLTFVGLGLYDAQDISLRGLACVQAADLVFLEEYTSRLAGTTPADLARLYGKEVRVLSREEIEQAPGAILDPARDREVVLLAGGDPMVSTTHADLRLRAHAAGIPTRIVHGASVASAVCGETGLQNYRFGKSCSIPFPEGSWFPVTPLQVIRENLARDLHTLVYLDIRGERLMTVVEAVRLIGEMAKRLGGDPPSLYVGVARAGSDHPVVAAGTAAALAAADFGPPLHVLVVPASLHPVEREYLEVFAGL